MASVLLTGASSFTGLWIAEALAADGHRVVAPLRRAQSEYAGLRRDRVGRLSVVAEVVFDHPFGSRAFLDLVRNGGPWDVLAHHAADIANYRDPNYDVGAGVARNLAGVGEVCRAMVVSGARAVIATGTTFEAGEGGAGPDELAVNAYGLSKGLTYQGIRHLARWEGLAVGKFVIAAPFGPWEEGRFVWSLVQRWLQGLPAIVRTPDYVRDNLPVGLMADAYARFLRELLAGPLEDRVCRPAGFVGPQVAFARRVAEQMASRLGRACEVEAVVQTAFPEPMTRVNCEPQLGRPWDEAGFWDRYADYYIDLDRRGLLQSTAA